MLQFEDFILDKQQARLLHQGTELTLDPKVFELLTLFTEQPNIILSREYLLEHVWSGVIVTDNAINKLIANLRKVLKDDPKNPRFIQTVPKRGYRFICEVSVFEASTFDAVKRDETDSTNEASKHKWYSKFMIGLVIVVFVGILWQLSEIKNNKYSAEPYTLKLTSAQGAEISTRMHPNGVHLYYLKKRSNDDSYQLWVKDINTSKQQQLKIENANISQIIDIVEEQNAQTTHVIYLEKMTENCSVYQSQVIQKPEYEKEEKAGLGLLLDNSQQLFDCSDKRIKDVDYHADRREIYYTAQPQNFMPTQIFVFNLQTKTHKIVSQDAPDGWGHHQIDIAPDGSKLLIMSNNSDHNTQLLVLDLYNSEITKGKKFDYLVKEAIWYHDSDQILYHSPAPANQIMISDIQGGQATSFANIAESLSSKMSLFPDNKNILFNTERKNFRLRWLGTPVITNDIDNTLAYDIKPALFHHNQRYLFVSDRSGHAQIYMGQHETNQANIVTNFQGPNSLSYLSISADDEHVLLSMENEVYNIPIDKLNEYQPLNSLHDEHLIFSSKHPIIWLDWLSTIHAAITFVKNGVPELKVVNVLDGNVFQLDGSWSYGLLDTHNPNSFYLVEQHTYRLYKGSSLSNFEYQNSERHSLVNTQIALPEDFYHVKIDSNTLYYCNNEDNNEYLNVIPIHNEIQSRKHFLNDFDSYDITNGTIMLSDLEDLEGDVHRTMR